MAPPAGHLVLVGMMASGKTTVGKIAAKRLNRPFLDSDAVIEERTGFTVRELWESGGEAAFRRLESEALLAALADPRPTVIAAAGGVVLSPMNRRALRQQASRVVWLHAGVALLAERVAHSGQHHRPLLDEHDPAHSLARLEDQREALYAEVADRRVEVAGRTPDEIADEVLA
jgi:shikimate kinase